jgi:ABC-type phosphate transport system substrate-binding protein
MNLLWKTVLLILPLLVALPASTQQGDIAVVVSPKNSVATLTQAELRRLLSGEKRTWPGGEPVKLFVRAPGTAEHTTVLKLLAMSEDEYKKYWTSQVFRGESQGAPVTLPSNGMQKEAVAAFPGALALVALQDLKPGMKVVRIDGHLPGESGYPLH